MSEYNVRQLTTCEAGDCYCIEKNPHNAALECLYSELELSKYGKLLHEKVGVRFSTWRWDSEERMKYYLPDTDPVKHGWHQALNIAVPMIEMQNNSKGYRGFTEEEAQALLVAHVLHDAHEGLVGDVALPQKTRESDEAELAINLKVVAELLGEEPDSPFMQQYRGVVGDFEGWSFAGRAFKVGEKIGYFMTGLTAWSLRNSGELLDEEKAKCAEMGAEVCKHHEKAFWELGTEFSLPLYLVGTHKAALKEMGDGKEV